MTDADKINIPIIADIFHRMDKVERMGSGIERMRELMRDAGLKEPVFEMDSFFMAVFYRDQRYSLKTGEIGDTTQKSSQKGSQKSSQKILDIIKEQATVTIKELSERLGISDRAVKKNITRLKEEGLLRRVGPDKGGHWEIVDRL